MARENHVAIDPSCVPEKGKFSAIPLDAGFESPVILGPQNITEHHQPAWH